ncbi:Uncharacterised protein [Cedecea neteri]|uniref:Uncharacterized protein n=1 Tax=Cedecea neteri TaxID=158822 RepID=A0A2X3J6M1_9ENTR|nr:Uncharacterised protein [Cedecea neteri]
MNDQMALDLLSTYLRMDMGNTILTRRCRLCRMNRALTG